MKTILRDLIKAQPDRRIDYEQYMRTVLYHPEKGYYHRPSVKIGKEGDFYTSPSVHPVFGRTLARFIIDLVKAEHLPPIVCEVGAGDGRLAKAILDEWKRKNSFDGLTYITVEESNFHRDEQKKMLPADYSVVQYESMGHLQAEMPAFSGILFSNELLDALPVRVVTRKDGQIFEVKITLNDHDELIEILEPCEDQKLMDWMGSWGFPLRNGQRIEIPLAMTRWLENSSDWLERGAMITIDYGYTEEEWKEPARQDGSLRGYWRHRLINDPLHRPGEMDLTSHVHVDAIRKITEANGLDSLFTVRQQEFLLRAGILDYLQTVAGGDPFSADYRQNRAIRSLVEDTSLGNAFYVMAQGKGLEGHFIRKWLARDPIREEIEKRR